MKDGHVNKCKKCNKKDVIDNRNKKIDYYKNYDLQRNETQKRRDDQLKYTQEYRKRNPEAYKSHIIVNNAIRSGKLIKLPCCVCGSISSQAHHEDYSKPLDVIWVCAKHHHQL
jgi:hypothetical protein